MVSTARVLLDVGGKTYATTVDTLTRNEPDSMLAAMFSGRHTVSQDPHTGMVFIDRNGERFSLILDWLRDGTLPPLHDSQYHELLIEAEYYQMLGLVEYINKCMNQKPDDEEPELTRRDVIKCIQSKRVRFSGVNLSQLNLSKLDLCFVDFRFACLNKTVFSWATLQNANLQHIEAVASNFEDANLENGCVFKGANLCGSTFERANLQSANLRDSRLVECSFRKADLSSACFQNADLTGADLTDSNLGGANLKGAELKGTKLTRSNFHLAIMLNFYVVLKEIKELILVVLIQLVQSDDTKKK